MHKSVFVCFVELIDMRLFPFVKKNPKPVFIFILFRARNGWTIIKYV